ncbi:hypothetical protein D3C86_578630 [compost metagenome]
MKLGQAKTICVLDDHDGGVGHVDADLDDRGGDQQRNAALGELGHHGFAFGAGHLAVGQADLDLEDAAQVVGAFLGGGEVDGFGFGHQRADPIGLSPAVDGRLQSFGHLADADQRQDGGGDGRAARRFFHQAADFQLAVLGQFQGARNRGGRHGQQVDAAEGGIALGLQPLALVDAKPVLFVDDGQGQAVELDRVLEQGVSADGDLGLARGQSRQPLTSLALRVAAGQQDGRGAGFLQHRGQALIMLAGQDFGRRHQGGLEAAGGRVGQGQGSDSGLARPHVALQQSAHLLAGGQVGADFLDGAGLGAGQGEGQGGQHPLRGLACRDPCGRCDLTRAATARQGQLVGEQLVIGQPLTRGGLRRQVHFGRGRVQALQRRAPAGPATRRQPGGVLPLGQLWSSGQRALRQLPHHARGQALGRRIDGFGQGNLVRLVQRQDVVGVRDLHLVVEALDLARHQPPLAARGQALDMARRTREPDQVNEAGVVGRPHLQRRADLVRRDQPVDQDVEDADLALDSGGGGRAAALDDPRRRQEQHIAHQRTRQLVHQRRASRPHALQGGDVRKQGKENLGPH